MNYQTAKIILFAEKGRVPLQYYLMELAALLAVAGLLANYL